MLDLWQNDTDVTAAPQPAEGKDLPVTFGEGFDAAWNEGRLFAQSIAGENARMAALDDHVGQIEAATGKNLTGAIDWSGAAAMGGPAPDSFTMLDQVNDAAKKLDQPELSHDDLEQAAVQKSRDAQSAYAALAEREKGPGAGIGEFLGGAAAAATDPINLAALPFAPEAESTSILAAALRWGVAGGVAQAGIEAAGAPFHEEVQPGYLESGAPLANVGMAFGQGALLGGGTRFLGNAWTRVKTGAWPQSVRDAGNLVESEANIANTNVYPGADGEAAHRQALSSAIDSILGGKPVEVSDIITPELEAQSRNLMMRLEGERGFSLPVFDERTIRLISEEAQLHEQDTALAGQIGALPEGDISAVDRLNRLQAVEQQIAAAPDAATRQALGDRRDQILVDTTPEALQQAAAPVAQRQALGAQRGQIASRLAEIQAQRGQIEAENLGRTAPMLGQTMPIRGPAIEDATALAMRRPIVETPMPSGANSSKDLNGPVYVDPKVPEPLRRPVAVHETVEQVMMNRGLPYEQAHIIATQAEKRAVEAAGMNWEDYTHQWDGLLSGIEHEKVSQLPPDLHVNPEEAIGHHGSASKQVRAVPIMQTRALAARLAEEAKAAGRETGAVQPQLPFEANAAVANMRTANEVLAGGVQQVAKRAGYAMPDEEAARVADRLVKATPEEADDVLRELQVSPRQVDMRPQGPAKAVGESPVSVSPEAPRAGGVPLLESGEPSPETLAALRSDVDRERAAGDVPIPATDDKGQQIYDRNGKPVMGSLDAAMNEVDAYKTAADEIQACSIGPAEPEAEAA